MVNINKFSILFLFTFIFLSIHSAGADENPEIKILVSGKQQKSVLLNEMKQDLKQYKITVNDPYYSKEKHYEAFKLIDFLTYIYGSRWNSGDFTDLSLRAYDGYDSIAVITNLNWEGGYLVYRDLDFRDWEPISSNKAYPGPFYVVWTNPEQSPKNGYPWPWQLESINLITFVNQFPEIVPKTADKSSSAYKGYELFKARCVRCHSINREGGKIGPDLNAPQNILEYRAAGFVKSYIKDPSSYRFTQMPNNRDFNEADLDNLISYFIYNMKENRWTFEEKN